MEESFTFNIFNSVSEAIHVNLVGYSPDAPHKAADLYHWLGSGGPRDYSSFEGNTVYLHNVATGAAQAVGAVQFWKQSGTDVFNYNLTGSDVWAIDFSGAAMPGQSPADATVYLTTMQPYHPNWSTFTDGDKWDKPSAWVPYVKSTPPTTNPNAWGGHSDAADWDRHLGHVANIYDLLLPYLMSDGAIDDDDLGITESGNGMPDIIDEARNEVDFWLRLRDGAGYSHGLTNPNGSNELFQAGPTPIAAWANAANAAMLADAFRIAGRSDLMTDYQDAAAEAYAHASSLVDQMLDEGLDLDDGRLRGRDLKMMAAAFLYNVTGVTVTPASAVIDGGTVQLHAAVSPGNATDPSVTWSSSNDSVASVNRFGHVLGHAPGNATITVTTGDGGFTDTADITVTSPTVGRVIRVMPLGNSITEGYTIPGGYRLKLWQNLENDGLDCGVDLVGTLNNNSVAGLDDPDHEGHSGWTTGQILAGIDSYLAAATPDVVMMHLGTNDIAQDTAAEAPANLRGLIDHICAALPADGRLYVAKIIPMGGVGNPDSLAYNDMIVAAVTEKQNEGLPVYLVDAAAIWSNDLYSGDWTHPNQQGYDALGDFWFDVMHDDVQLSCGGVVTLPGDVNNDRSVDLADAISALKVLTGNQTGAMKEADVNGDDVIGMEEAVYILRKESTPP